MTKRISLIEIDLPKCANTYGVATCTASVGVTGSQKCFNCLNTCQDTANYSATTETVRYAKPSTNIRPDPNETPNTTVGNISSISYTPPRLNLGESLGTRASLTVNFQDHPSPDTDASGDKYLSDRAYNPFDQGSYFGKLKARYPFLQGSELRWIQGTDDQQIADMETRTFVIESMTGPSASGSFTITAKDILKLADNDRAVLPFTREWRTDTALTDTDINVDILVVPDSVFVNDPIINPAGDIYMVLSGSEIVTVSVTISGGNHTFQVKTRGEFGTEAIAHDVDSSAQDCVNFAGEKASSILDQMLRLGARVSSSYISLPDWTTEDDTYINRLYSSVIATPTGVAKLVNELLTQTASTMWWDNQSNLIRWQVLRNQSPSATVYSQSNYLKDSFNVRDDNTRRASRCFVRYGQKNPLLNLDEPSNFEATVLRTELESEAFFNGKEAYRTINSRWIPGTAKDTAERLGDLILQRYSLPPRKVGFRLLRDTGLELPQLAGSYNLQAQTLQNADGSPATMPIQVTSIAPDAAVITVTAEEINFNEIIQPDDPNVVNLTIAASTENVNVRDLFDAQAPAPTADTVVNISVASGVVVGSANTSLKAFDTGTWPAGATLNLTNNGTIAGAGGAGGVGGSASANGGTVTITAQPTAGLPGGDAMNLQYPISIDNQGIIGGGGGGGGGAGAAARAVQPPAGWQVTATGGSGGSGGAGSVSGSGGSSGSSSVSGAVTPSTTIAPSGGIAGGLLVGGPSANASLSQSVLLSTTTKSEAGTSGSGGDLGQNGASGGNGVNTTTGGTTATNSATANGASGGAAGDAIVTNGNAITWVNMGDIRGAVN